LNGHRTYHPAILLPDKASFHDFNSTTFPTPNN